MPSTNSNRNDRRLSEYRRPMVLITTKEEYEIGKAFADQSGMSFAAFVSTMYHRIIEEMMSERPAGV